METDEETNEKKIDVVDRDWLAEQIDLITLENGFEG